MLSPVCRLSVCNVRAPYFAGWSLRLFIYAIWYLGHLLTSTEKNYGDRPRGTPPSGSSNARRVAKYSDFWHFEGYISRTVQDKLVLITNRKWYISFRLVPKSVTWMILNGEMALILRYFTKFGSFRDALRKSGWQSHNNGQFRLLCLVVNVCSGTARRPRYKYSTTARWKFCSRVINSRLNA